MKRRRQRAAVAAVIMSMTAGFGSGARAAEKPLPSQVSLLPEYTRYGLAAQTQRGDTCWAYSVVGCLELELSRARKAPTPLSPFYLIWAASRADKDVIDSRGSNFGRAARALARFGVAARDGAQSGDENAPLATEISPDVIRSAESLGQGIAIDWIRFWKAPPGLTDTEMESVKRHLAEGHPVAVGMRWPKQLTVEDKSLCLLGTCRSEDETFDGHCVTLVGYEDDSHLPGGGAFRIRNSWGPEWMEQGYGRMSYAYLKSFANDAVSFRVGSDSPNGLSPKGQPPSNATGQPVQSFTANACRPDSGARLSDDDMSRFSRGRWHGDHQIACQPSAKGQGFEVDITGPLSGAYTVSIAATRAPDYGIWRVLIDGKPIGPPIDFCWPNVEPTGELRLGTLNLAKGKHNVRFECIGKSETSSGMLFGLDWIRLELSRAN